VDSISYNNPSADLLFNRILEGFTMKERFTHVSILLLLAIVIFTSCFGCAKKNNSTNTGLVEQSDSGKLVSAIYQASTETQRQQAIENIVSKSFSLGLIDLNGKQINPNVDKSAISLSPITVATYSQMDTGSNYRTIEYIVGFLASAGIRLDSTGSLINLKDFLPDLQEFVLWSFKNPDNPKSVLGIMIASGSEMVIPDLPPLISGDTKVAPLTSLLMMGDILIGTNVEKTTSSSSMGGFISYAAAAGTTTATDALDKIRGLITTIKGVPILSTLLPQKAQNILAAFETCDRLSLRMWQMPTPTTREKNWINDITNNLPLAKIFRFEKNKIESINVIGGVGLMSGVTGSPVETIEGVDTSYRFQLFSYDEYGTGAPLYDDADAMFNGLTNAGIDNYAFSTDLNGHRLTAQSQGNAPFIMTVKSMSNTVIRRAVLYASAQITAPENLYEQAEQKLKEKIKNSWALFAATSALDTLPWKTIEDTMKVLNRDFQPTPWMCTVEFTPIKTTTTTTTNASVTKTTVATSATTKSTATPNITLDIELPPVLETLETLIFKTKLNIALDQLPQNVVWQWEFGDGTPAETKVGRTESVLMSGHRYLKNGDYQVKLSLIDQTTKQTIATTTRQFIISDIASIKNANHLRLTLTLSGKTESKNTTAAPEYNQKTFDDELYRKAPFIFEWYDEKRTGAPGQWGGDEIKFKGSFKSVVQTETGTQTKEYWITGKIVVDKDGVKLVDYYYLKQFSNPNYNGTGKDWSWDYGLKLNPIPITKITGGTAPKFQYHLKGFDQIFPYIDLATYSELLLSGKEIQWQPMLRPELTGSDLLVAIDTYNLNP
jgi:hypothetical protein